MIDTPSDIDDELDTLLPNPTSFEPLPNSLFAPKIHESLPCAFISQKKSSDMAAAIKTALR